MRWILDLPGPRFLAVFLGASLVAHLFWFVRLRPKPGALPHPSWIAQHDDLDAFALAYLAGGVLRAVQATLTALVARGLVRVNGARLERVPGARARGTPAGYRAEAGYRGEARSGESRLTLRVLGALSSGPRDVAQLVRTARADEGDLRAALVERGLLAPGASPQSVLAAVTPVALVAVLGFAKLARGLALGRPVVLLAVLLVVHVSVALLALTRPLGVTALGERVLDRARARLASLELTVRAAPEQLSPLDQALACAVFGASVLAASQPELLTALGASPASGGDGAGAGCGASCGSGCGAGCGGCGA
jgi:uncharacterized protein (TIGR04222 family)